MLKKYFFISALTGLVCLFSVPVFANKTSVVIEAPDSSVKGASVTIKINVFHKGNNLLHYTNWVYVKVNGKEIARWDFSSGNRPENENFSKETTYVVDGPVTIEAGANCNIHGSDGIVAKKIEIK